MKTVLAALLITAACAAAAADPVRSGDAGYGDWRSDAPGVVRKITPDAIHPDSGVIRLPFQNGRPTGTYEDFLTGFVAPASAVWGGLVGLTVTHDAALLVSEDGNGVIWRVSYRLAP